MVSFCGDCFSFGGILAFGMSCYFAVGKTQSPYCHTDQRTC